jgi:glucose/arabinose dehydrogenase
MTLNDTLSKFSVGPRVKQLRLHATRGINLIAGLSLLAGLLPLPAAVHAAATPTFIQGKANSITTGTVNNTAFTTPNAAGNLAVVYVLWGNTGAVTITDTAGNAYAAATPRTSWGTGNTWSSQTFYAKNIAAGTNTVRATFNTAINATTDKFGILYIHEYAGIDKINPVDVTASATGTTSAMSSGTATTTNPTDLIFGAGGSKNTVTAAGSGFTTRLNNYGNRTEDRNVTATSSYAATANQNSNLWVMEMVAFRADAGSADAAAPTTPTGLTATPASSTQVNLSWTASTDNVGVTGYRIYRGGTQIGTSPTPSYQDTGLTPETSYSYTVSAYDAANNTSAQSSAATATTPALPSDPSLMIHIEEPAGGANISGNVTITAHADSDQGIAGVQFYIDGVAKGAEDTTDPYAYTWDTRGTNNGAHTLTARARNTPGNTITSAPITVNVANTASFQNEVLATGFNLPVAMKFMSDGRLLVAELKGVIKVMPAPYTTPSATPFLQITNLGTNQVQQGIYDFALDPNFATNHYFYVFYTAGTPNRDRLSRFTANPDLGTTNPSTELVLYEDPNQANSEHHGGAISFANDGKILFTTGENFDANVAPLLTNPRGKVHRINPDGTVPTDNPFYDGAGPNWDSIWARGLRNPYRAYYDSPTGRYYIGDVGGNNNATSQEELNLGLAGANYGWPATEGVTTNPAYTSPLFAYPHAGRDACITGGFIYHGNGLPGAFPSSYEGAYFYGDYAQNWIRGLNLDASSNVTGTFNFEPADGSVDGPYGDIVYLIEGPEGSLYYLDLGYSDIGSGTFGESKLRRIRYVQTNQQPVAMSAATPTSGSEPLTVNFSSAGSMDPEGQPLSYNWAFGDGTTSTEANPIHTYVNAGPYTARLSVSDGVSTTLAPPLSISVGNAPTATILTPLSSFTFQAGDTITYSGDATDTEDGGLPASAYTWRVDLLHGGHTHFGDPVHGVKSGSFTVPTSPTDHSFHGDVRYAVNLSATDSSGLTTTQTVVIYPQKVNLTIGSQPAGRTIYIAGVAYATPIVYDEIVGYQLPIEAKDQIDAGTNYTFASWSDGGTQAHTITVPTTDTAYTATYNATPVPTGLAAAWGFNEAAGTTTADSSSNGNTGTFTGAGVTWSPAGHTGAALSFDGTAGYLNVLNSPSLGLTSSHTFEAWIKPSQLTGYESIFTKETVGGGCSTLAYWLQLNGSRISGGFNNGTTCVEHPTTAQNLTTGPNAPWYHIAAVFDDAANTYKIYLNGNLVTTQTENGAPVVKTSNLMIGQSGYTAGANERWRGLLDDIRIYNRPLTQAEIQADMNTGL